MARLRKQTKASQVNHCHECNRTFTWRCNFLTHLREKHRLSKSGKDLALRFSCGICGRKFSRKYNMKQHMHTHKKVDDRPVSCPECPERFNQRSNMKRHYVRRHEKPYSCPRCHRRFKTDEERRAHINAEHANEKKPVRAHRPSRRKLVCACKRSFREHAELTVHQSTDCPVHNDVPESAMIKCDPGRDDVKLKSPKPETITDCRDIYQKAKAEATARVCSLPIFLPTKSEESAGATQSEESTPSGGDSPPSSSRAATPGRGDVAPSASLSASATAPQCDLPPPEETTASFFGQLNLAPLQIQSVGFSLSKLTLTPCATAAAASVSATSSASASSSASRAATGEGTSTSSSAPTTSPSAPHVTSAPLAFYERVISPPPVLPPIRSPRSPSSSPPIPSLKSPPNGSFSGINTFGSSDHAYTNTSPCGTTATIPSGFSQIALPFPTTRSLRSFPRTPPPSHSNSTPRMVSPLSHSLSASQLQTRQNSPQIAHASTPAGRQSNDSAFTVQELFPTSATSSPPPPARSNPQFSLGTTADLASRLLSSASLPHIRQPQQSQANAHDTSASVSHLVNYFSTQPPELLLYLSMLNRQLDKFMPAAPTVAAAACVPPMFPEWPFIKVDTPMAPTPSSSPSMSDPTLNPALMHMPTAPTAAASPSAPISAPSPTRPKLEVASPTHTPAATIPEERSSTPTSSPSSNTAAMPRLTREHLEQLDASLATIQEIVGLAQPPSKASPAARSTRTPSVSPRPQHRGAQVPTHTPLDDHLASLSGGSDRSSSRNSISRSRSVE